MIRSVSVAVFSLLAVQYTCVAQLGSPWSERIEEARGHIASDETRYLNLMGRICMDLVYEERKRSWVYPELVALAEEVVHKEIKPERSSAAAIWGQYYAFVSTLNPRVYVDRAKPMRGVRDQVCAMAERFIGGLRAESAKPVRYKLPQLPRMPDFRGDETPEERLVLRESFYLERMALGKKRETAADANKRKEEIPTVLRFAERAFSRWAAKAFKNEPDDVAALRKCMSRSGFYSSEISGFLQTAGFQE